ncbi:MULTISPECIES: hypothetical protein [Variovorax]|uniref:hypothetical protein n=1 Tax=Variovorax TaxID=34072 RepID=UPI000AEA7268|nr:MULTISPECIES: hypothetical protein [Variovorax]MBN8756673.1 hypothetical protein [Variovorax sp.]UKI05687.1 hypothetical protein L3V85_23020 [Variovorax paradoxus]
MKWYSMAAGAAVLVGGLAGCGGGGGGGGGGLPLLPIAATALSFSVTVNGNSATADSNGQYSAKPGDTVAVIPNTGADWTSSSAPSGSISLRNPDISSGKWSAQLVNSTTAAGVLTISAKASSNAALTKDAVFKVSAGDARNGSYKVFASNGTRQALALNFDTMSYVMTDDAGTAVSDSFSSDPTEAGTYLFKSARNTAKAINTRFRITTDTVVGSFPFQAAKVPGTYAVQPFVASRAMVTTQSALDGAYTRMGINLQAATRDSNIRQVQVANGGTMLYLCDEIGITSIAACPPVSLLTYNVTAGVAPDAWNIVNVADPQDSGTFYMASVAGKNVYLAAGTNLKAPNDSIFRIGLSESAVWPVSKASGGDTAGNWGTLDFTATTYTTLQARSDATGFGFTANLSSPSSSVLNLRVFTSPSSANYFASQDGTLSAVLGARAGPAAGYIQIGLMR